MADLRCSLVIPRAANGKFIISLRAKDKHPFPNTWVCGVGGKAADGESFEDAARREMQEEIGVSTPVKQVGSFKYDKEFKAEFVLFTTDEELSVDSFTPDPHEIQYLKAFSLAEIKSMLAENPDSFAPTFRVALIEFEKGIKK